MRTSKHFLIGLISVAFVCGTVGVVTLSDGQAGFFKKKKAFPQAPLIQKWFQKTVCGFRNPEDRFVTSKDGKYVCDRTTGDIWEQDPESNNPRLTMSQPDAISFCANLGKEKGHGQVYELPSVQQLVSVLDYALVSPALTPDVFSNVLSAFYWSATSVALMTDNAWVVSVGNGNIFNLFDKDLEDLAFVWCVRRGKDAHADW